MKMFDEIRREIEMKKAKIKRLSQIQNAEPEVIAALPSEINSLKRTVERLEKQLKTG